jgi:hypothetical protein
MIGSSSFGAGLLEAFAEAHRDRDFEGQNAGVHVVVGAVDQRRP